MTIHTDARFDEVFDKYPDQVQDKMKFLRNFVRKTAKKTEGISSLEETVKWGEPSFVVKKGSTLRMDWKAKKPNQYALYFQCTSKLVATFRMLYQDIFTFEGNRAIIFQLEDALPEKELEKCIQATLLYHRVKHLPTLGI